MKLVGGIDQDKVMYAGPWLEVYVEAALPLEEW